MAGDNTGVTGELMGVFESLKQNIEPIATAITVLLVGLLVGVLIRSMMRRSLGVRVPAHIYKPLENLVFYGILAIAGMAALTPFGVSLSTLVVAGGFAGIVVGLAGQNALSNLISGIMLLIEQPLRVGDPVSVAGVSGVVLNISVLSTRIRTWDGPVVRIPNNDVFNAAITNYARVKARRVEFGVSVHYDTDVEAAVNVIKEYLEQHPFCLVSPAPEAFVENYGDSGIQLKIRCWSPPQAWFATKVDLQTRIKRFLEEKGIRIPYPQLDLHLVSPEKLRVEIDGEGGQGS